MSEVGEAPRVRMPSRGVTNTHSSNTHILVSSSGESNIRENAGLPFWNRLDPERQKILEAPIRRIEEIIARQFSDGYVSPGVARVDALRKIDGLERQQDATSCTYVATANALRVLDQVRPEFTRDAVKRKVDSLTGTSNETLNAGTVQALFSLESPYNNFNLQQIQQSKVRLPNTSPEMSSFFRALQNGDVAVASWRMTPEGAKSEGTGFIDHARTIVGFQKLEGDSVQLHVIDPYGARSETWSFRDWVVASRMNVTFDNPSYDIEDVRKVAENLSKTGGTMHGVSSDIWLLHKKRPQIKISNR